MASRVYIIGSRDWFKTNNKFKVFFNIQIYRNKALSIKRFYIKESEIKIN